MTRPMLISCSRMSAIDVHRAGRYTDPEESVHWIAERGLQKSGGGAVDLLSKRRLIAS